ncbi:ATP-dependent DNA helicase RecQ [Thalassobacillus sp. CUG 92003]|uniref:RecQ family ATP-dependent DNA helicase n=1 Tax=Thalassobacillus sp. CUG 92003 TaxID=2736641 RepID=UPI0015E7B557|nr:RecQ family ATP-dependent DNA helicase [Thalassobacillus sp. CUG 92003]
MAAMDVKHMLYDYFGYENFREGQEEIINDILKGHNCLGILPTGSGKSLCYQLPSLLLPGVTIVISPLISLMIDQVKQLKAHGIKNVAALNSFMDRSERAEVFRHLGRYNVLYMSPEMIQNEWVQAHLKTITVSLLVVDEAHCISQWGHEFRTDYMRLASAIQVLGEPTILALSATATPDVQQDIINQLSPSCDMVRHVYPMDRTNISFAVERCSQDEDKLRRIRSLLESRHVPSMIYFSSRQWTEQAAYYLQEHTKDVRISFYHGGMEQTDRLLVQQQFMNNQLDVVCCTSAFGMGVDKQNIRMVIHFHVPAQVESFIQEVGRAGRDGRHSVSLVLYNDRDYHIPARLNERELPAIGRMDEIFRQLEFFMTSGPSLPADEDMQEALQLSEAQWNFLQRQLEIRGLIAKRKIRVHEPRFWQAEKQRITEFIKLRMQYKQSKLTEMISWIDTSMCRREQLFSAFQDTIRNPEVPCCDGCGFCVDESPRSPSTQARVVSDWQERLRRIFNQEVTYGKT